MADGHLRLVIRDLRRLVMPQTGMMSLSDAQLLEAFLKRRDEAAFEVLVWRHATMVLNLCRRILRDEHQAEDAFQASFLIFVRKAGSIGKGQHVGTWLYKVASRVALTLRAKLTKQSSRRADFTAIDNVPAQEPTDERLQRQLYLALDEEIGRLPEKYRAPIVLRHLRGHTNSEAAAILGCPDGAIRFRLSRGMELLRNRLAAAWHCPQVG